MSKRVPRFPLHLSEKEFSHLNRQSKAAGLSMQAYTRRALSNKEIKAKPPEAYVKLVRVVSGLANNFNQVTAKINSESNVTKKDWQEANALLTEIWKEVKGM